jgi:hypothetical protein
LPWPAGLAFGTVVNFKVTSNFSSSKFVKVKK